MKKVINIKGITVVELLISSLISLIVFGAAMGVFLAQNKHLVVQDQISDMQHNLRAGLAELSSKIRMAGYNVPSGLNSLTARNSNPDSIEITYDTDVLENVTLSQDMPQPSSELRCNGDLSGLHDGDWAYIYDPGIATGEFLLVTSVQTGTGIIQHSGMPLLRPYPVGSQVFRMNKIKYYIDNTTDPNHPALMVQNQGQAAQIYADNITDLQLEYILSSGAIVTSPPTPGMVREVKINMTARTERSDDVGTYGYRTRNLETTVKVRNLGIN